MEFIAYDLKRYELRADISKGNFMRKSVPKESAE